MSEKRKIFINGRFLAQDLTGVQVVARETTQALDRLIGSTEVCDGYEFEILAPNISLNPLSLNHIQITKVGRFRGHLWEQLDLPRFLKDGRLICLGNTAPIAALTRGKVLSTTVHDISFVDCPTTFNWKVRIWYRVLLFFILRFSKLIFTDSKSEAYEMRKRFPNFGLKIWGLTLGAQTLPKTAMIGPEGQPPYILFVGSMNPRKNLRCAIEAFGMLNGFDTLQLKIVGVPHRTFSNSFKFEKYKNSKNIIFLERVDNHSLAKLYANAKFLVFPSVREGFGLPALEAMSLDCPVLASELPSILEICQDAALYFNPFDVNDLRYKMEFLLNRPNELNRMSAAGRSRAKDFSWDGMTRELFDRIRIQKWN